MWQIRVNLQGKPFVLPVITRWTLLSHLQQAVAPVSRPSYASCQGPEYLLYYLSVASFPTVWSDDHHG